MNLDDAKKEIGEWMHRSKLRVSDGWNSDQITDAAQMLMEAYCKIEQLRIAHAGLVEENQRLAALRDTKTEAAREVLIKAIRSGQCSALMQNHFREVLKLLQPTP